MSPHIVVGYTATDAGADAVSVGARLAQAMGAVVDLIVVLPGEERSVITPPDAGYDRYLFAQAEAWLAEAAAGIPDAVTRRTHVRYAESFAEGLVAAAGELGASHIVVGAANGGIRGRHRLGTVASELLHSSDVPVVLAPEGSRRIDPGTGVTRITTAIGTRPGADALMDESVALATATGSELRLLSLVSVDLPATVDTGVIRLAGAAHADDVLGTALDALPDGIEADVVIARGESIEDAVANLGWEPGELAVVGSSRLAQPRRLFLGSTAAKMLHELPVPMIVVPRTRGAQQEGAQR
ncbi:nucleotide-binding universal stress UspA family protein [Microbacterium terrae]|uniref:Universal stress protein family protein n=1 Tax=Microbacterium terrae TaxID=69369 RepID=A0A0M2GVE8_9MICO|nr:universal stress protein [Microbacterium terrae]KJL37636.1 Universal stress protein family protein [Microbacterium terrae]MBP1076468.1 nucleotide-binding universal stress UspA family protein [Microbacterium terrae]GLJ97297.1 universal stress protein UspA [Microbacterium terrae]